MASGLQNQAEKLMEKLKLKDVITREDVQNSINKTKINSGLNMQVSSC